LALVVLDRLREPSPTVLVMDQRALQRRMRDSAVQHFGRMSCGRRFLFCPLHRGSRQTVTRFTPHLLLSSASILAQASSD
jgi:hypothetical protein